MLEYEIFCDIGCCMFPDGDLSSSRSVETSSGVSGVTSTISGTHSLPQSPRAQLRSQRSLDGHIGRSESSPLSGLSNYGGYSRGECDRKFLILSNSSQ